MKDPYAEPIAPGLFASEITERVNEYARTHGRKWKSLLADDWYYCRPKGLIDIRNTPGGHEFIAAFKYKGEYQR